MTMPPNLGRAPPQASGSSTKPCVGEDAAPWSAGPTGAERREQLATGAEDQGSRRPCDRAGLQVVRRTCRSSTPASASRRDQVAVLHPRERAADGGLRREVDGGRHLARGAGHPAVGDQRDPLAAVLEDAERGGELVQLRHAVGRRALEAETATKSPSSSPASNARRKSAWSSKTRAGALTWRCSGLTAEVLITARPRLPSSIRRPPSLANGSSAPRSTSVSWLRLVPSSQVSSPSPSRRRASVV